MNQDLKKTLWAAADKLRSSMDAAEYKHIVLGLIFLKYISDAFDERRDEIQAAFSDEASELYLPDATDRIEALEERDYYTMVNTFWVPAQARWEAIRARQARRTGRPDFHHRLRCRSPRQGPARRGLRVFSGAVRQRRGQEGRPVLHAGLGGQGAGRSAGAAPGPRLRPRLRLGRHVRAEREVHRGARRQGGRHQHLRPGGQPHHLAPGRHEPRHPRLCRRPRQGTRRHLPPRPAPRPQGRLRPRQSAVQHQRLGRRTVAGGQALGLRRAAGRQRQLRLAAAHPPSPEPARSGRRRARQRQHVVEPEQRRRHPQGHGRGRRRRCHGRAAAAAFLQHADSGLPVVPGQGQDRGGRAGRQEGPRPPRRSALHRRP
ncbi:MAG: type I restriction-modification system subunit M N-terminal domain-containing protein [Thiobacillus sp.]|nr:type I restriction-modification system subunit M N-terminal domain-containing protein [Thiobacillus sp.]